MYKPVDNEKVVDESDSEANRLRKGRRARREEWVMVVRDEDEESAEQTSQTDMVGCWILVLQFIIFVSYYTLLSLG